MALLWVFGNDNNLAQKKTRRLVVGTQSAALWIPERVGSEPNALLYGDAYRRRWNSIRHHI